MHFSHTVRIRTARVISSGAVFLAVASYTFAQTTPATLTQDEQDVRLWYTALTTATVQPPASLAAITPAGKDYITSELAYAEAQSSTITWLLTTLPGQNITTAAQAKQVGKDVAKRVADLNKAKQRRDTTLATLNTRITSSGLPQSLVDTLNSGTAPADEQQILLASNKEHAALLDALFATKTFYTTLGGAPSHFTTSNNHFIFDTPLLRLEYWTYIASLRSALQAAVRAEIEQLTLALKNKDVQVRLRGADNVQALEKQLADMAALAAPWSAGAPQPAAPAPQPTTVQPSQSSPAQPAPTSYTLTVDDELTRRFKQDTQFAQLLAEYNRISDEFNSFGWFSKESVVTKVTMRRAISLGTSMLRTYKQLEQRGFVIQKQYDAEYPLALNAVAYALHISDEDMKQLLISVQNQALAIDSPQFDIDLHTMLLTNKFTTHFGEPDAKYKVTFTKPSAQAAYVRKLDAYNAKYALALEAYTLEQEKQAADTPAAH